MVKFPLPSAVVLRPPTVIVAPLPAAPTVPLTLYPQVAVLTMPPMLPLAMRTDGAVKLQLAFDAGRASGRVGTLVTVELPSPPDDVLRPPTVTVAPPPAAPT